jgi:hypothetical protein
MGWARKPVADAIAAMLSSASPTVAVFADPPSSFNVPAFIVAWPATVFYNNPTFGVDLASLPVLATVATDQSGQLDDLLNAALGALIKDPSLGGLLTHGAATVREQRNWRILADVAGARFLAAELVVEVRM